MKLERYEWDRINRAEGIIINPLKKQLREEERQLLAWHRRHLTERIKYLRGLLESNYKKCAECEGEEGSF